MNVYLRELRAYRRSTITWAVSLSGLVIMFMSLFPAFTGNQVAMQKIFDGLPEIVRTAFNLSAATLFSLNGFYGYLLSFATLAAAIQAMNIGTGIISKEVAGKTADFLLSKPIPRTRVVSAKLAAALTSILITDAVFWAVALCAGLIASSAPFALDTFALLSLSLLLVQLMFVALGALFAVSIPKIKSVIAVSLPTVFAFYIVGMIGDVVQSDSIRYVSPFKFFVPGYITSHVGYEGTFLLIEAVFVIAAIAAAYVIYLKKDVRASS